MKTKNDWSMRLSRYSMSVETIMESHHEKYGLVSNYTIAQYKPSKSDPNESPAQNHLQRKFQLEKPCAVVVSDLTYVRVTGKWHYVRLLTFLTVVSASGPRKTVSLVYKAIASLSIRLDHIQMFHTDRCKESSITSGSSKLYKHLVSSIHSAQRVALMITLSQKPHLKFSLTRPIF